MQINKHRRQVMHTHCTDRRIAQVIRTQKARSATALRASHHPIDAE